MVSIKDLSWIGTNDTGLDECYRKWKKRVKVLFLGPLSEATETIKCNYMIYWSGDHGMDLVDKWTTEGKITNDNKNQLATYWKQFEEYIHPQTNQWNSSDYSKVL